MKIILQFEPFLNGSLTCLNVCLSNNVNSCLDQPTASSLKKAVTVLGIYTINVISFNLGTYCSVGNKFILNILLFVTIPFFCLP